jgi:hypothetical protein
MEGSLDDEEPKRDPKIQAVIDDQVCDIQDAFFEGRYQTAIKLCKALLEQYDDEEDTYDMLLASHLGNRLVPSMRKGSFLFLARGEYEDVIVEAQIWVEKCGESLKQLVHLLEAAYMIGKEQKKSKKEKEKKNNRIRLL